MVADEAVGGGHPPVLRHAPGRLLGVGEGVAQARVRQHRQDPPLERPEAGREPVHGENALRRPNRPFGGRDPRAVRVLDGQRRGVLVEIDVPGEGVREPAHERDRIHQRSAGRVDGAREVVRSELLPEHGRLDPLERLAEPRQRFGEGLEVLRRPAFGHRGVVLPLLAPVAVDAVGLDLLLQMGDPRPGQTHVPERVPVLVRRSPAGMGEVDREPRIPPRRAVRGGGRVDNDDPVGGPVPGQPARRGEAGPAGADHQPVGADVSGEARVRGPRRQVGRPTVRAVILRKEVDAVRAHGDSRRSADRAASLSA